MNRQYLDRDYHHEIYSDERILLQDKIVLHFLDIGTNIGTISKNQWLFFVAGPMGAGKSSVVEFLLERGYLPLESPTIVDMDKIRILLPEYSHLIRTNPLCAGLRTQKESGLIAEILVISAVQMGKSVIFEGTLRHMEWYTSYMARLRELFTSLRLGVIHVKCDMNLIKSRVQKRAYETQRNIPDHILIESASVTVKSLLPLLPMLHILICVDNTAGLESVLHPKEGVSGVQMKSDLKCPRLLIPGTSWDLLKDFYLR